MHYVDWSGGQHGHLLYDPFEDEAALLFGNHHHICPEMKKALQGVFLIAEQKKRIEESTKVRFTVIMSCNTNLSPNISQPHFQSYQIVSPKVAKKFQKMPKS